jgi:hypothetical protein
MAKDTPLLGGRFPSSWPSRSNEEKIYGKRESCRDVVDDQIPFHPKKQSGSRCVTSRIAHGVVALPPILCAWMALLGLLTL